MKIDLHSEIEILALEQHRVELSYLLVNDWLQQRQGRRRLWLRNNVVWSCHSSLMYEKKTKTRRDNCRNSLFFLMLTNCYHCPRRPLCCCWSQLLNKRDDSSTRHRLSAGISISKWKSISYYLVGGIFRIWGYRSTWQVICAM